MLAYLITGNPWSGKSTLATELRRRGLVAVEADELAFWGDEAGLPVDEPADADSQWRLAHRWVWVFQSQMLALGAIPLDATAPPPLIADALLGRLGLHPG